MLYAITADLAEIDAWIDAHADEILAAGGALSPELDQVLAQVEGELHTKLERIAFKCRELNALADAAKAEADRLTQRCRLFTNAAKSIKEYAKRCLEAAGRREVKTALVTVGVHKNPPALRHQYTSADLLALLDAPAGSLPPEMHLRPFIAVERTAKLAARELIDEYEARRAELLERATGATGPATEEQRAAVERTLASEYPGVTVERGTHLRIS